LMPMKVRDITLILVFGLAAILVASLIYSSNYSVGTIQGTVTIGPWTPVEHLGDNNPPPKVYTSRKIILEGLLEPRVEIVMNGTGYFTAQVKTGTYSLTMSNCTFLGCSRVLPIMVNVKQGEITKIQINIDTGIR